MREHIAALLLFLGAVLLTVAHAPASRDRAMVAACSGDVVTVESYLLRPDADAAELMTSAALHGQAQVIRCLLETGADPNAVTPTGHTVLMFAAYSGSTSAVRALIEAGADANAVMEGGWTALMFAVMCGDVSTTKLLLEAGADVERTLVDGTTITSIAERLDPAKRREILDLLRQG